MDPYSLGASIKKEARSGSVGDVKLCSRIGKEVSSGKPRLICSALY